MLNPEKGYSGLLKHHRKIANALQPNKEARRRAVSARREFRESIRFSDAWLTILMVGFGIFGRWWGIKTETEVYVGVVLIIAAFLIYLALKSREDRAYSPLQREMDRLD